MFSTDLLVAFVFMALLFLRQVSILKHPNKINYAPLMIGIGAISSVIHFIIHPDATDVIHLLRESFFPLLVALFFYIVMNILHQTQQREMALLQDEFTHELIHQVSQLKEFVSELEVKMVLNQQEDREAQKEVREKFKQDIKTLDTIEINQKNFMKKFEDMQKWHKDVENRFEHFTDAQMPELDNMVHKHIDMLRVAEQEHYNKIKEMLNKAIENKYDVSKDIEELKVSLGGLKAISTDIARVITKHTLDQLSGVTQAFQKQIEVLKSQSEAVRTSLWEGENTLGGIKEQSQMIMKQMVLTSKKMDEIDTKNAKLHDVYLVIEDITKDIENIKTDYVKSQSQLTMISKDIQSSQLKQIQDIEQHIESLSVSLSKKIDESLQKLHEHYHIAQDNITQSVQMLNKKSYLKEYEDLTN